MVKVTMKTPEGRETDLLPDTRPLEEALESFHLDFDEGRYTVNGKSLREEDRARPLLEFSRDAEVRIVSLPVLQCEPEEDPDPSLIGSGERADIIQALLKVKDAINKALDELSPVTVYDGDEPPF